MVDMVTVRSANGPTEDNLRHKWEISTHIDFHTGEIKEKYIRNCDPFKGTYYPIGYKGDSVFILDFSLPKVLYGMNWPMVLDIPAAVARADEMLAADPGWLELGSVGDAEIVRLDACYNHSVGDDLHAFLQALSRSEYRSRQTVPFLGTGVEYRCGTGKTKFYDKRAETNRYHPEEPELWAPPGTLRQESTLRSARGVAQATRARGVTTLNEVTPEIVLDILRRDLKHLGIIGCQFATRDVALEVLCDRLGPDKGFVLTALCAPTGTGGRDAGQGDPHTATQHHAPVPRSPRRRHRPGHRRGGASPTARDQVAPDPRSSAGKVLAGSRGIPILTWGRRPTTAPPSPYSPTQTCPRLQVILLGV